MLSAYKVAGASLNQTPLHWQSNIAHIQAVLAKAQQASVDCLCLPELCITGYGCDDFFFRPSVTNQAMEVLRSIIPLCKNITLLIGLPVFFYQKLYNCVAVVHHQQLQGFAVKKYLASEGIHYEQRWFTPWFSHTTKKISIDHQTYPFGKSYYTIQGVNIGIEICEDAWQTTDKRPAYDFYQKGVDIIFNASASHFALHKRRRRAHLVIESAKKYHCLYVYTNLLGNEAGKVIYDGEVMIASPKGMLQKGGYLSFEDHVLVSQYITADDLVPNDIQAKDCAIITSTDIFEDFVQVMSLGLFDYLRKSKQKKFVLSLSGGADSSACVVLIVEMVKRGIKSLGLQHFLKKIGCSDEQIFSIYDTPTEAVPAIVAYLLVCVYQKTKNSSQATQKAAQRLTSELAIPFFVWDLDTIIQQYTAGVESILQQKMDWPKYDIPLQNIQARSRVPGIWMLANALHALLLTTANMSEVMMGYTTMDGDMSGSLAPLGGVDKHFIMQFLGWAEKSLGYTALQWVHQQKPQAELRPAVYEQQDEKELMPYVLLADLTYVFLQKYFSKADMIQRLQKKHGVSLSLAVIYVQRFLTHVQKNQWKRERMPPSFHVLDWSADPKTFLRWPIFFDDSI